MGTRGHAQDAAFSSHEVSAAVIKQKEQGAEYASGVCQVIETLGNMSNSSD